MCNKGYFVERSKTNLCEGGAWINEAPICTESYCSMDELIPFYLRPINCSINGSEIPCQDYPLPDTVVNVECHERFESITQHVTCNQEGNWTPPPEQCMPICGEVDKDSLNPNIKHCLKGEECIVYSQIPANVPWQAIIAEITDDKIHFRCTGTIISPQIVITDIFCLLSFPEDPQSAFVVRVQGDSEVWDYEVGLDSDMEYYNIKDVKIPNEDLYVKDIIEDIIVLLVLSKKIEFQKNVAPACIFPEMRYGSIETISGIVSLWENVTDGNETYFAVQIAADLPFLPKHQCYQYISGVDKNLWKYYSNQNLMCVGNTSRKEISCQSHGHGWVYPMQIGDRQKYYLGGIISSRSSKSEKCYDKYVNPYINIQYFKEFIISVMEIVKESEVLESENKNLNDFLSEYGKFFNIVIHPVNKV